MEALLWHHPTSKDYTWHIHKGWHSIYIIVACWLFNVALSLGPYRNKGMRYMAVSNALDAVPCVRKCSGSRKRHRFNKWTLNSNYLKMSVWW